MAAVEVWTIGHSTRAPEAFVAALQAYGIQVLVDIRRFPASRRNPQYNTDELRRTLRAAGVDYVFLGDELGGYRQQQPASVHEALRGRNFQAYADHLYTPLYEAGVSRLLALTHARRPALMCAERKPKDCHRKILSDDLALTRGVRVMHILDADEAKPHEPTPTARIVGGRLRYALARLDEFSAPPA